MRARWHILALIAATVAAVAASAEEGIASWYGADFHGKTTSNGEVYDMEAFTAAHRTLPFGSRVRVTNLDNGKQVVVRINDRGPFVEGRIIDLSRAAASVLLMLGSGIASVRLEVLDPPDERLFAVQLGAFVKQENATRVQHDLRRAGIEAVLEKTPSRVTRVIIDNVAEPELPGVLKHVAALGFTDYLVRQKGHQ